MDVLSHKARLLEAELERKSRQLKEANEQARDEGVKNQTTKEVIQSLTIQVSEFLVQCLKINKLGTSFNPLLSVLFLQLQDLIT